MFRVWLKNDLQSYSVHKNTEVTATFRGRVMYKEGNEMTGFAIRANESLTSNEVRDLEWFKNQLIRRGVSSLEIVWGNYETYFHEVPAHLMDAYLLKRQTLLHKQALEHALSNGHLSK